MAGVDLSAFVPARCPEGHYLRDEHKRLIGGSVLIGWQPCTCPSARSGVAWGHMYVICEACGPGGIIYHPPCEAR